MKSARIIGPGRAGNALATALAATGWDVQPLLGRNDSVTDAAEGVDLLALAVPDGAVAPVAAVVRPASGTVVMHLAGALGLDVLGPHPHRGSLHPLVAIPDAAAGARRLQAGAWFAVAGSDSPTRQLLDGIVERLQGRSLEVPDDKRASYHAAACIASNHLVALLGQAERVAADAGVPLAALLGLVRGTIDNIEALGPRAALTGPVARGDEATLARHLDAIAPAERPGYAAMVALARKLRERPAANADCRVNSTPAS